MSTDIPYSPDPKRPQEARSREPDRPVPGEAATMVSGGAVAHSYELIGRMAGGIIHDFNKVLTVLLGNVALLQASLPADASQRLLLTAMENAANQAADLARQLLALARHESPRTEPVDLNAVAEQVASMLRHTLDPRISLVVQPRAGLSWVLADRGRLVRVLLNLCLNARDAMPQGGRLRIATDEVLVGPSRAPMQPQHGPDLHARLTVEDTGEGMSEEIRARSFDPSFTTKLPGVGTGLGLAIVASLVQEHGGWIECNSAPGRGTRFDIYLPLLGYVPTGTATNKRTTILIVENEPQLRELARTILEKEGFCVIVAADGRQAVAAFRQATRQVALVLLDLHSAPAPLVTLAELRLLDPEVRIVLVDGQQAVAAIPEDLPNIRDILAKPFRPADLLAAVRVALGTTDKQDVAPASAQQPSAEPTGEGPPPTAKTAPNDANGLKS